MSVLGMNVGILDEARERDVEADCTGRIAVKLECPAKRRQLRSKAADMACLARTPGLSGKTRYRHSRRSGDQAQKEQEKAGCKHAPPI